MTTKNSATNPSQEAETVTVPKQADPLDTLETAHEIESATRSGPVREIDDRVKRMVENGLEKWKANPRGKWAHDLGSPDMVKQVTRDARAHAKAINVNFRVFTPLDETIKINGKDVKAENALVYRVSGKTTPETPETPETAEDAKAEQS